MQASRHNQTRLYRSRMLWRSLAFILFVALALGAVSYNITKSAETKAKHVFALERQELVTERLSNFSAERYRTSPDSYEPSPRLTEDLRQLFTQGQFSYILLLDKNGVTVAQISFGLKPETMNALASIAAGQSFFPSHEVFEFEEKIYENSMLELPGTDKIRVFYGIKASVVDEAARNAGAFMRRMVFAGLGVAALLLVFFLLFYLGSCILPLRRGLAFFKGFSDEKVPAVFARKDELGEVWKSFCAFNEEKRVLNERPVMTADRAFSLTSMLLEEMEHGILIISPEGTIKGSNRAARKVLRYENISPQSHILPLLDGVMNPAQRDEFHRRFEQLPIVEKEPLELVAEDVDGVHSYAIRLSAHAVLGVNCILCIIYDVSNEYRLKQVESAAAAKLEKAIHERTEELMKVNEQLRQENAERRAIEQALVRAESRYREIVNNSIEGIFQRTADGRLLSVNASLARILGYSSVEELLDAYQKPGTRISYTSEMEFAITELLDIRGWVSNLEFQALMQDGSPVWVAMNARRVADSSGETLYYEAFIEDITSRKKTEEKLVYQAFHDPLTGLPNRALFLDRLRMALRRSKRHNDYLFAVLYLDLDRFKNINDSFGHSAGDKMLNHATEKLLQCVRDADTVARFGGDEFAVLLADLEKPSQAVLIAKRISAALNETVNFHGQDVSIGASIGIVLNNLGYDTPEEILRDADTAMYRAKMHGRRGYTVFNERMREETIAALALESDLRGAVERGEIEAFYQPLVDIDNGRVFALEALMRWRRNNDIVSPVVFIPIAEETGLIYELGLEMMQIVCKQVVEWNSILGHSDFSVHVNISSKQLMATSFWRDVQEILIQTGVNPRQLIFEITESVFLDYGSQVISIMNIVRDFGIRFCLDDFGTGFSSLSYLRMLPLESLKVDRSFIVDINNDNYSEAILRNLVSMGSDLGLRVITEGVDQSSQVDVLRMVGCRFAQGFFFAEPLPSAEASEYMLKYGCLSKD